ncbi:MAG: hypothetical protein NTY38_00400 [Acidobacteria bacterium]|nr:hypothetical protein [Acidobacteriota bacterium]
MLPILESSPAGARLEDLTRRTRQALQELAERTTRARFQTLVSPLLAEARGIPEQSAFDNFAGAVHDAANDKIAYHGPDRERSLLYWSALGARLLELPLSGPLRQRIELSHQDDGRLLYSRFGMSPGSFPDVLRCFFLDGAEADPDESMVLSMYRITERKLELDYARRGAKVRIFWETCQLLIPRSVLARKAQEGATARIKAVNRSAAAALSQEGKSHEEACQAIEKHHAKRRAMARQNADGLYSGFAGAIGYLKVEVPFLTLAVTLLAVLEGDLSPWGLLFCAALAAALGRGARLGLKWVIFAPVRAAGQVLARERLAAESASAARRREIQQAAERQCRPDRAVIDAFEAGTAARRYVDFPAYQAALLKGFREGQEPSPADLQMTGEELSQARIRLHTAAGTRAGNNPVSGATPGAESRSPGRSAAAAEAPPVAWCRTAPEQCWHCASRRPA